MCCRLGSCPVRSSQQMRFWGLSVACARPYINDSPGGRRSHGTSEIAQRVQADGHGTIGGATADKVSL